MESVLASWQNGIYHPISVTEYSPPISPSPTSPTLYTNAHGYTKSDAYESSSRAAIASSILRDLESQHSELVKYESDTNMDWTEESVNLELFENIDYFDLYEHPYTPASPEFKNQEYLQEFDESPQLSPSDEIPTDSFDELSAEFQSILTSLSSQTQIIAMNGEIVEILGFSINNLDGSVDGSPVSPVESSYSISEASGIDSDDESYNYGDFELKLDNIGSESSTYSPSSSISEEEGDEDISITLMDAILQENLNSNQGIHDSLSGEVSLNSSNSSSDSTSLHITKPETSNTKRYQRRLVSTDSKSKTGIKKPRLPRETDKVQRKKEQNKTAATRYREKKKLEAALVNVQEDDLEKINVDLITQRDDLRRQVLIYKELLRDVMLDRKIKKRSA